MNVNTSLYSTQLGPPSISSEIPTGLPAAVATPARRKRRPALSCIQCRSRKLKCDRTLPSCARCTKSKNTVCAYDPETLAKMRGPASASSASSSQKVAATATSAFASPASTSSYTAQLSPGVSNQRGAVPIVGYSILEDQVPIRGSNDAEDRCHPAGESDTRTLSDHHALKGGRKLNRREKKKMRFFGMSHWIHICKEFDQIRSLKHCKDSETTQEVHKMFKRCKDMARAVKAERSSSLFATLDFRSQVPTREISDELIQHYFRTSESAYRVVHRPSFLREYEEYWASPTSARDPFVIKLLLVLANGAIFSDSMFNGRPIRVVAVDWINTAQNWLTGPSAKVKLSTNGIELHCLLVLAQQTHSVRNDLFWIDAGSLVRSAMSAGLHRDPSLSPKLSLFNAEMRRRLWATVIEIATQASLDCGMPPMFSFDDFDCDPPANYNDEDIDETTTDHQPKKDNSIFTETSVQRALLCSLQTRLEICKLLNGIRSNPAYEKVLTLSTELTSHIRSHAKLYQASDPRFTALQKIILDLLTRRFLLALHCPFAIQASTNPRLYFSRKLALEAALIMLSPPPPPSPPTTSSTTGEGEEEPGSTAGDFDRMTIFSGSPFQDINRRACALVCLELINQIREDSSPLPTTSPGRASRRPLHDAVEIGVALARRRVQAGEVNVKGWLFTSMVQAQIVAMEAGGVAGADVGGASAARAREVAGDACEILGRQVVVPAGSVLTPAGSSSEGLGGGGDFDWDVLMQETMSEFDIANSWLFNSWEDGSNIL